MWYQLFHYLYVATKAIHVHMHTQTLWPNTPQESLKHSHTHTNTPHSIAKGKTNSTYSHLKAYVHVCTEAKL